ncbi:unnamed protein product [Rotaria magnacalcarata]
MFTQTFQMAKLSIPMCTVCGLNADYEADEPTVHYACGHLEHSECFFNHHPHNLFRYAASYLFLIFYDMDHYQSKTFQTEMDYRSYDKTKVNSRFTEKFSTIHDLCCDIWEQIFEYFEVIDLFMTLGSITMAADQVLFNDNNGYFLRGLTLGVAVTYLPERIPLYRIISLTLHENVDLKIIEHCSELRSLKLIGENEWITYVVKTTAPINSKLIQLTIITPIIRSLPKLLTSIVSIPSLRRLEIHTDDLTESSRDCTFASVPLEIEQFVLNSSSIMDWNNLLCMLSKFFRTRLLNISLIDCNHKSIPSFIFYNLRNITIGLLEVSFDWIIQLVATIPCLVKLKLTGLVEKDGYVVDQKWISLFESAPLLTRIFVNVSLQQVGESYHCENIQAPLCALNLKLVCNDGDDCYLYDGQIHLWWSLRGVIIKQYS